LRIWLSFSLQAAIVRLRSRYVITTSFLFFTSHFWFSRIAVWFLGRKLCFLLPSSELLFLHFLFFSFFVHLLSAVCSISSAPHIAVVEYS
jgi:hypothetical protein